MKYADFNPTAYFIIFRGGISLKFQLNIADIILEINYDHSIKMNRELSRFAFTGNSPADVEVCMERCKSIEVPESTLLMEDRMKWIRNSGEEGISIYTYEPIADKIIYQLRTNENWTKASILYLDSDPDMISIFTGSLGEILFRNRILFHKGIVIHAAAIEWNGKGILFSAPPGTGKTTQANLWKKYLGAKILNADRPAVKLNEGGAYVYGTPWSGSSPRYLNKKAPLAAIVMLEQAKVNSLQRLDKKEAISYLMPRSFLPYYNMEMMNQAIDNLENMIQTAPVYLLRCRPDKEAMEMVYECVK
jgi:hypothetical protein